MKPIIINPFTEHPINNFIISKDQFETGKITLRNFPDGETYIKFDSNIKNKDVIILASLEQPNDKILPLLFLAETAKQIGAKSIGLCAPYLSYMRQDKRFKEGEGITSDYFAALLSNHFDWLVTIDPHLHRHHHLSEIYSIPNMVIHAAPLIANWISNQVTKPVLIGPDEESRQWVSEVAKLAKAPFFILEKIRHGDNKVEVSKPQVDSYLEHTPVLVDDIISTAHTMIETINHLNKAKMKKAICIGVHGVFAGDAYNKLLNSSIEKILTCNTISHETNAIDLSEIIFEAILKQL